MASDLDFLKALWNAYRKEAEEKYDYSPTPGDEAAWGGLMICAKTDNEAEQLAHDMKWFWEKWAVPFGRMVLPTFPKTISYHGQVAPPHYQF